MARILIAEHNESTQAFLAATLKKAGHSLCQVGNSLDAWRAMGQEEFDIIAVDISLPGIDGFVLAQRALQKNPETQIIFITGFAGVAMDTYGTPPYAPAPVTMPPFHLKDINSRVRALMGQGGYGECMRRPEINQTLDSNVIYADFATKGAFSQQLA